MLNITRGLVATLMCFALFPAHARVCVYVHGGNGDYCMKFSKEEQRAASRFGLQLGTPYKHAWQRLTRSGWSIDREWLQAQGEAAKGDLVCGQGRDAGCSTVFKKNGKSIQLDFSATNDGMPLISVETELP